MNVDIGLNFPETYVITHNRYITYMVLIFSDLNKAQIYKIPYRDSPHHEIEILMSFNYLHLFRPFGKADDGNFLFEIEHRKYIFMWEKIYLVLKQMMKLKDIP